MDNRSSDENGWLSSSTAWLKRMPEAGDFAREYVLDTPMLERARLANATHLLDVGCGDGRFCRMVGPLGIKRTGIDPVPPFVDYASQKDPEGQYITGFAENLPFSEGEFDLVVFYLTLIDIDDMEKAIHEAVRVLRPGGRLLIANLSSFSTSNGTIGWITGDNGERHYPLGDYFTAKRDWFEWDGLRVRNWHRPLSAYMTVLLACGLTLTYFDEPSPVDCTAKELEKYRRNPYLMMMEWQKPS